MFGTQEWIWIYFYITVCVRGQKATFLAYISLLLKKKKCCHTLVLHIWFALGKICSQLLCASGGSLPGECNEGCLFFPVSLSLCWYLLVNVWMTRVKLECKWEKRKQILKAGKTFILQADLWIHVEVRRRRKRRKNALTMALNSQRSTKNQKLTPAEQTCNFTKISILNSVKRNPSKVWKIPA